MLTSETSVDGIVAPHQRVQTTTIQIVDELKEGNYADLKTALPGVEIVQVIHVLNQESVEEALQIAPQVDALLLDSGNPNLAVKVLGGTGKTHNWALSRQIVEQAPVPVFLAGGLRAENVQSAIRSVQPFGLDLCSGVRTDNELDAHKLESFFEQVNAV